MSVHRAYQKVPERVRDPYVPSRNASQWRLARDSTHAVSVPRIGRYVGGLSEPEDCGLYCPVIGIPLVGHSVLEYTVFVSFCRPAGEYKRCVYAVEIRGVPFTRYPSGGRLIGLTCVPVLQDGGSGVPQRTSTGARSS